MTQKQKFNLEEYRKFIKRIGDVGIIISKDAIEYLDLVDYLISINFIHGRLYLQSGDVYSGVLTKHGKTWLKKI